jgi:alkylhydroperoxidase family enzyme
MVERLAQDDEERGMESAEQSARVPKPVPPPEGLDAYRLPDGRPLPLFETVAHSAPALADLRAATARSLQATQMPMRLRELLILRVLDRWGARAEFDAHLALFGDEARITDIDVEGLSGTLEGFVGSERDVLELADALVAGGEIPDELWDRLMEQFGTPGTVEAVFIGAQYLKVAVMNNAFRIRFS